MTVPITPVREAALWPIIKRVIPDAQRLETGATALGIPDVFYSRNLHHGWIELKVARWLKKGNIKITWRPGQIAWLEEHDTKGGHVWVFIITEGNVLWLVQGRMAGSFAKAVPINVLEMYGIYCGTRAKPEYDKLNRHF